MRKKTEDEKIVNVFNPSRVTLIMHTLVGFWDEKGK